MLVKKNDPKVSSETNRDKQIPFRLYGLIVASGALVLGIMGYGFFLGNHMIKKYTPLVDAAMEIKLEATSAHLWLEEILSGDRLEDIETVKEHLDNARWYASAMLMGGENPEGVFIPLVDPVLRKEIEKVQQKIDRFRKITLQRYETLQNSGTGTEIDQRYDAIFRDFIGQADRVENKLQSDIQNQYQLFTILQGVLISVSVLLLGSIIGLVYRFERRIAEDMHIINNTNDNLQKALEEVKTLRGIIPICSNCKKIRDEEGLWSQVEAYIQGHSDAEFSHSLCPDCYLEEIKAIEEGRH